MEFGQILKLLRKQKKITQRELADELCVDRTSVCKWECGANFPNQDILILIADYFDVSVDYLIGHNSDTMPAMLRIKELRKAKGWNQTKLASLIGVTQANLSGWEMGKWEPDVDMLKKLAEIFGVTVDYLLGRAPVPIPQGAYTPDALMRFPVIGSIKAGFDGQVEEYETGEYITIPVEMLGGRPPEDYLVFEVRGNSMYPKLLEGDRVLVLRTDSVDSGTTAVVSYNGDEATIKKVVYKEGENWLDLIPANPEYQTKRIEGSDLELCRVVGKAVKLIRDI